MTNGVRVEQCPNLAAATQRKTALEVLSYRTEIVEGVAGGLTLVSSKVSIDGGHAELDDKTLASNVPYLVIGVL